MRFNRQSITAAILLTTATLAGCASEAENKTAASELYQQGQALAADKKPEDAAKKYDEALVKDPKNPTILLADAQTRTEQKKYDEAIKLWRKYVTAVDNTADAWNNLAYCQDLAGWDTPAESSYQKALEANPRLHTARINYGLFLARHGRPTEAICQLQLALPPAQAHYNMGVAYDEVNKTREARMEYRKALSLQPNFPEATNRLNASTIDAASAQTE